VHWKDKSGDSPRSFYCRELTISWDQKPTASS